MINKKWGLLLIPILILIAYFVIAAEEPPIVILNSPTDQIWSTTGNVTFNCSAELGNTSYQINEVELIIYRANAEIFRLANTTNGTTGVTANRTFDVNVTNLTESYMWNYTWTCNATTNNITTIGSSNLTYSNTSSTNEFGVDLTDPVVTLVHPTNGSTNYSNNITFTFNVTDLNNIKNCSLYLNDELNTTNSSLVIAVSTGINQNFTISNIPDSDNLPWNITCYDQSERSGTSSSTWYIDTYDNPDEDDDDDSTTSSSGGGYRIYRPTEDELNQGYQKTMYKYWKILFKIEGISHTFKVEDITEETANISISSETQESTLSVGEEAKFDVTEDNYYDVLVKLDSIYTASWGSKANFTIKTIYEEITTQEEEEDQIISQQEESIKKNYLWWIVTGIIIVGIVSYLLLTKKKIIK